MTAPIALGTSGYLGVPPREDSCFPPPSSLFRLVPVDTGYPGAVASSVGMINHI